VRETTWNYIGNEPYGWNHHTWRIEQVERLAISRLLLGTIAFEPYDYVESVDDDGVLRLAARALVSEQTLATLSSVVGPTEVVRVGISDTARRMRLSGYVWGERYDGLVVAFACQDVREPRVTIAGFDAAPDDDLVDLIALANVDADELARRRHARRKVADVDAWDLMK
jgi:hypothetical protein